MTFIPFTTRFRSARFALGIAVAVIAASARAESPAPAPLTQAQIEALARTLMPTWQTIGDFRTALGWNSNVLLAAHAPTASSFARADWETSVWRQPRGRLPLEVVLMANGTQTRFFSASEAPNATEAFVHAEARRQLPPLPLRLALSAQGYFLDGVLDFSTEAEHLVARLRAQGGIGGGALRWDIGRGWWLEGATAMHRSDYRGVAQDFTENRYRAQSGWERGAWEFTATLAERQRAYDERRRATASGRLLAGTRLHYTLRDAEVGLARRGVWHGNWKVALLIAAGANRDDGAGYYDYNLRQFGPNVQWQNGPWKIECRASARRYEWPVQTVGVGVNPPRRVRDNFAANAKLERQLGPRWLVHLRGEWERARSNDPDSTYGAVRIAAGAGRSF